MIAVQPQRREINVHLIARIEGVSLLTQVREINLNSNRYTTRAN